MRLHELHGPSFGAWFAGSKVVDASGHPKRMYHGTRFDVRSFDIEKASPTALYGPGFYFTDSPNVAGGIGDHGTHQPSWDDIEWKAAFNQAGYAWQGAEFEIDALNKRQLAHVKRLFTSKAVQRDAYEDIGTRKMYQQGWKAFQTYEQDPKPFMDWLAREAPRWWRDKLKADRRRTTTPNVMPVYLAIKNPFEMDAETHIDTSIEAWRDDFPADHPIKRLYDACGSWAVKPFVSAFKALPIRISTSLPNSEIYEWLASDVLGGDKAKANAVLQKLGYDGIHHEGGRNIGTMGSHDVWIAFRPSQIKSVFNPSPTDSPNVDESAD